MSNIFCDKTYATGQSIATMYDRTPYMRAHLDQTDLFYNEANVPGSRKYPMDVVSVERPRRGHGY